jgi:hypothetical protein
MADKQSNSLTKAEEKLIDKLIEKRTKVQTKYPLLFILLVTFGAVATLQGFQRLVDRIPVLSDNPWLLLVAGLVTLTATGTLYKKLN